MSELDDFLEDLHFIYPNFNDTFYYASADTHKINSEWPEHWDADDDFSVANFWRKHGWYGLVAIGAKEREEEPIKPIAENEKYIAARKEIDETWTKDE